MLLILHYQLLEVVYLLVVLLYLAEVEAVVLEVVYFHLVLLEVVHKAAVLLCSDPFGLIFLLDLLNLVLILFLSHYHHIVVQQVVMGGTIRERPTVIPCPDVGNTLRIRIPLDILGHVKVEIAVAVVVKERC